MKRMLIAAFTQSGIRIAEQLRDGFSALGWDCQIYSGKKGSKFSSGLSLSEWTKNAFRQAQAICFVGASGIAVRSIAPFLKGKDTDPAVLVADDQGQFVISLLSGHLGGANRLTRQAADLLGAVPVITTATDNAGLFSVDEWAQKQNMAICGLPEAKAVSAALLEGNPVGFISDFPIEGNLPRGVCPAESGSIGIQVTTRRCAPRFDTTLFLVPRIVALGIGCRKGTPCSAIAKAVEQALEQEGVLKQAVARVCSADLKREESGLLEFCRSQNLPFQTFSAAQLSGAPGEFSSSEFVRSVTGVDNVCERSAVLGAGNLIIKKRIGQGVTVAAATEDYRVLFEKES